jgi:hypothetical protein
MRTVTDGLYRALAGKLGAETRAADALAGVPQTHATDFAGDAIGCVTLSRREMRSFGYFGIAFACEEAASGEVLGAVLDRRGLRRCLIEGDYVGDDCYRMRICNVPETLCVR